MIRFEETNLSEAERHVLKTLGGVRRGLGLQLSEGKMADTAHNLIGKGFVEEIWGYYSLTEAGRSQLKPNR